MPEFISAIYTHDLASIVLSLSIVFVVFRVLIVLLSSLLMSAAGSSLISKPLQIIFMLFDAYCVSAVVYAGCLQLMEPLSGISNLPMFICGGVFLVLFSLSEVRPEKRIWSYTRDRPLEKMTKVVIVYPLCSVAAYLVFVFYPRGVPSETVGRLLMSVPRIGESLAASAGESSQAQGVKVLIFILGVGAVIYIVRRLFSGVLFVLFAGQARTGSPPSEQTEGGT